MFIPEGLVVLWAMVTGALLPLALWQVYLDIRK